MESLAFGLPLTPGRAEDWRAWAEDLAGPQRGSYLASRQRLGITAERCYYQQIPQGELVVVYLEGHDLQRSFQILATSEDPFDVAFRLRARDLFSGLDLSQPLPGRISEYVFDVLGRR